MGLHRLCTQEHGGVIRDAGGAEVGRVWSGNPTAEAVPPGGPWVCWTGWTGDARPEEGWFERTAAAWLPSAAAERERVVGTLVRAGAILWPHARHLISDIPGCLGLLRKHDGARVLLEPAAMLEPSMIETAMDHLERMLAALGASVWGVVLSDAAERSDDADAWCEPVAPGGGRLDMDAFATLVDEHVPAATMRIVRA